MTEKDTIVDELMALYDLRVGHQVELFLGVELDWKFDTLGKPVSLVLSQALYTEIIFRRFCLHNSKPACTPMVESSFTGLSIEQDKTVVME